MRILVNDLLSIIIFLVLFWITGIEQNEMYFGWDQKTVMSVIVIGFISASIPAIIFS